MGVQKRIILASQSKIRRKILKNAGLSFSVVRPRISEDKLKKTLMKKGVGVERIIEEISTSKSKSIFKSLSHSCEGDVYSIGSDQGLIFQETLYSKVKTEKQVYERLRNLRNKEHSLYGVTTMSYRGECIWTYKARSLYGFVTFSPFIPVSFKCAKNVSFSSVSR